MTGVTQLIRDINEELFLQEQRADAHEARVDALRVKLDEFRLKSNEADKCNQNLANEAAALRLKVGVLDDAEHAKVEYDLHLSELQEELEEGVKRLRASQGRERALKAALQRELQERALLLKEATETLQKAPGRTVDVDISRVSMRQLHLDLTLLELAEADLRHVKAMNEVREHHLGEQRRAEEKLEEANKLNESLQRALADSELKAKRCEEIANAAVKAVGRLRDLVAMDDQSSEEPPLLSAM